MYIAVGEKSFKVYACGGNKAAVIRSLNEQFQTFEDGSYKKTKEVDQVLPEPIILRKEVR